MQASLRKLGALIAKDTVDLAKNPTMMLCVAMPVALSAFYRFFMGDMGIGGPLRSSVGADVEPVVATLLQYIVLNIALCMCVGMGGSMALIYGLAEEKEKHTLRTLMLANVTAEQIMLAKGIVALGLTVVAEVLCFIVSGAPLSLFGWFMLCGIVGAVPIILLSLVVGLACRDQMTAGMYSVPILLIALAPMFGNFSEGIRSVVRFAPTGGVDELLRMAVSGSFAPSELVVPLLVTAAWVVVAAIAFKLLYRRLLRDN